MILSIGMGCGIMSEKRFTTNGYYINDTYHDGRKWLVNEVEAEEIVDVMNGLDMKARERSKALSKLQKSVNEQQATIDELEKNFDDIVKWASEIAKRNVVLDEQIGQLQRENEQLQQKLDFYLLDEFEWKEKYGD